jgi:hypothetical protein
MQLFHKQEHFTLVPGTLYTLDEYVYQGSVQQTMQQLMVIFTLKPQHK